jgi:excisionase family DNA binding protein
MANSYSSRKAAAYLGISVSTLYRLDRDGLLKPFMTPGGHRRFTQSDLDRYIETSKSMKSRLNPSQYKKAARERSATRNAKLTPRQDNTTHVPPRNVINLRQPDQQ